MGQQKALLSSAQTCPCFPRALHGLALVNVQTGRLWLFSAGSQRLDLLSAVAEAQCGSGEVDGVPQGCL